MPLGWPEVGGRALEGKGKVWEGAGEAGGGVALQRSLVFGRGCRAERFGMVLLVFFLWRFENAFIVWEGYRREVGGGGGGGKRASCVE